MEPHTILSEILTILADYVKPGITPYDLDKIAEVAIRERGATSCNKGYKPDWAEDPFPASICTSINNVIAHGIPDGTVLKTGDIINIDMGIKFMNQCADAALTVPVGEISNRDQRLLRYAKRALYEGIKVVKPGVSVLEIGKAIESYAIKMGYVVNTHFSGHGIGEEMHMSPSIFHFDARPFLAEDELAKYDYFLKEGDILCIEPMITFNDKQGTPINTWTYVTRDNRNSAMFEHMVKVTKDGHEVLTTHIYADETTPSVNNIPEKRGRN